MKSNIYLLVLSGMLLTFPACNDEDIIREQLGKTAIIQAGINRQHLVETRSADKDETGTYIAFKAGNQIGLYTMLAGEHTDPELSPLRQNTIGKESVSNLSFTMDTDGNWEGGTPKLIWETAGVKASDIYGYFPYQAGDHSTGGYAIFRNEAGLQLQDVLIAERIAVENNSPAIFVTFKHRFALLRIELGTGLGGPIPTLSVQMNKGIANTAAINNGIIKLNVLGYNSGIAEFKEVNAADGYHYIVVPVEGNADGTDSLQVAGINVDGELYRFNKPFTSAANMMYRVVVHKGEGGTVDLLVNGIEDWGEYRHKGSIRETGGLYWPSDVIGLTNALNTLGRAPNEADNQLETYGEWDAVEEHWVFPLMRNIDMTEVAQSQRNCCIDSFTGILEGNGYSIKGLDIQGGGLFNSVEAGSEIRNLTLIDISVTNSGSGSTGAIAGSVSPGVSIFNSHVDGKSTVAGNGNTGGLIGWGSPEIDRCSANVEIQNGNAANAGGLVGYLEPGGFIHNSYAIGRVTSSGDEAGGLVGLAQGEIKNSHASCKVIGMNNTGGLAGSATADVTNCYATGTVDGTNHVGGLIGTSVGNVSLCSSDGSVKGTSSVGGLIGFHVVAGGTVVKIIGCSSRASVTGSSPVGGLLGSGTAYIPETIDDGVVTVEAEGSWLQDCYATNQLVLVGAGDCKIICCYEIGTGTGVEGNCYFVIPLDATDTRINEIIQDLNTEPASFGVRNRWVKGSILVNGSIYVLPVLNSSNN